MTTILSKKFAVLVKVLVSVGLLSIFIRGIKVEDFGALIDKISVEAILFCLIINAIHIFLNSWRWLFIHKMSHTTITWNHSWKLTWICEFFSQVLPGGSVSGEVVRGYRLYRGGFSGALATASVLLDKGAAWVSLVVLLSLGFFLTTITQVGALEPICYFIIGTTIMSLSIGYLVLKKAYLLRTTWTTVFHNILKFFFGALQARKHTGLVLLLSTIVNLGTIFSYFIVASELNVTIDFFDFLFLVPLITFASSLPISVAGWGIREGASVYLFSLIGFSFDQAFLLGIIFGITHLIGSLPGGVIWILERDKNLKQPNTLSH